MKRIVNALGKLNCGKRAYAAFLLCAATAIALPAQTFTTLHSFDGTDGTNPSGLVQAIDGKLYGATYFGGANGSGTVFKITPSGTLTTLNSFADSSGPKATLVQASNGNFYGTTQDGPGRNGVGTVFKITPSGTLTTLHSFNALDGYSPNGLIQGTDGNFYGTTSYGGAHVHCLLHGYGIACGTAFKITPSGKLRTLHSFCPQSGCPDGAVPAAGLVQATNENFYGTTFLGGVSGACNFPGCGTVFELTPNGTLTTLYSFCSKSGCPDGANPGAVLLQATDGNFYGTTSGGGANGAVTVFKITPSGKLTTLYNFCCGDIYPSGLVQATDENFYGTTSSGGANGWGTVFKITRSGTLTTLYNFCSKSGCPDGANPSGLVQDTDGSFYGTTFTGGANNDGTVFRLSVHLGPFVETQPTSGKVGATVKILGTNLTGASKVSFNGTAATFTVVSSSEIKATVPNGATTGTVKVTTTSRALSSNIPFRVR